MPDRVVLEAMVCIVTAFEAHHWYIGTARQGVAED